MAELFPLLPVLPVSPYDFDAMLQRHRLEIPPLSVTTLQVNVTRQCNQACRHCHVDASPRRTEHMDRKTIDRCLEILAGHDLIRTLDITGGAPELNAHFDHMVTTARQLGKHVMVRHNLTVTLDGHPETGESKRYLPRFYAEHGVEVVSSLPYYEEYFTDRQRGKGVFAKSVESMRLLNDLGYGMEGSGLVLDLVYNPVGTYLPAAQASLEADYKRNLKSKFGLHFNRLFTITNMPIHRFREELERTGKYGEYMDKLIGAFNPAAALGVMCRTLISVGYDGTIYDCDFNQMLDMPASGKKPLDIWHFNYDEVVARRIRVDSHCFGCTAGGGSSCGGATV